MDESYTGGDVIVQALKAAGVECVFGVISIHNIPIYDAIARQRGIRPITNRGEQGAVNMADGYAQATGGLGVAITSTGGGAGNAAGALIEAQTHGTPLLHLTGQIDSVYYPVTRVAAFRPAIETALASGRLSLVEIDMGAVGPFSVPFAGYALSYYSSYSS